MTGTCELCDGAGGQVLWQSPQLRIVRVDDADYPGFCRVIWNHHVREMTDLPAVDRQAVMTAVFAVEHVLRRLYQPAKINLASFGNLTPHVHWHIIPRWTDDKHFPQPTWGPIQRPDARVTRPAVDNEALARALCAELGPGQNEGAAA